MATRVIGRSFIEIVGDTQGVHEALNHLTTKLDSASMMAFLGATVYPWIRSRATQRFLNEGDDAAGRWAPLADSTNEFRRAGGFPEAHPINKRTGELERYITGSDASIVPTGFGTVMQYPRNEPTGALREKVRTAQRGKSKPSTRPRPVLSLGIQDLNFTVSSLALYIQSGAPDSRLTGGWK